MIDLTGQRFGRLKVLKEAERYVSPKGEKKRQWLCICDCGNEHVSGQDTLRKGSAKSCGCYNKERVSETHKKHGMTEHYLYRTWISMRSRCNDKNKDSYKHYGARGIKVCKRWDDFTLFLQDMGDRPKGTTLDRIDNDGDYEPNNCRWASKEVQTFNRRGNKILTHNNISMRVVDWARVTGIKYNTLNARVGLLGWNHKDALTRPVEHKNES